MFGDPNLFPIEPYTGQKYRVKEVEPSRYLVEWGDPIKRFHWFGKYVGERWFPCGGSFLFGLHPLYRSEESAHIEMERLQARDRFTPTIIP